MDMKAFDKAWKARANQKGNTLEDTVARCVIVALNSKSNEKLEVLKGQLLKAFTPATNATRLACQMKDDPFYTVAVAISSLIWKMTSVQKSKVFWFDQLSPDEQVDFVALLYAIQPQAQEGLVDPEIVYVWVDTRLPKIQQLVQTAHAFGVALAGSPRPGMHVDNGHYHTHIVVFASDDANQKFNELSRLSNSNFDKVWLYFDPVSTDFGNRATAVAFGPVRASQAFRLKVTANESLLTLD